MSDLSNLWKKLIENNSVIKGTERNYDPLIIMEEIDKKIDELVMLKVNVQKANTPIIERIYKIAELKSKASSLKHLSTKNGIESPSYRFGSEQALIEYESIFKQKEVDDMISIIESIISKIQDELEQYNFNTDI